MKHTVNSGDVKVKAMGLIKEAAQALIAAQTALQEANPMAADVPSVRHLGTVAKDLNGTMQEISKLRGL